MIFIRENIKSGALTETTFLILLSLYVPNHGYGIMQFIERETEGRVLLGAGTLYGALNTLLKKEWIKNYGENEDGRKKEFIITSEGKDIVENEIKRLEQLYHMAIKFTDMRR